MSKLAMPIALLAAHALPACTPGPEPTRTPREPVLAETTCSDGSRSQGRPCGTPPSAAPRIGASEGGSAPACAAPAGVALTPRPQPQPARLCGRLRIASGSAPPASTGTL